MNKIGLYLHFPFCKAKCAYCDFYSLSSTHSIQAYEAALCRAVSAFSEELKGYEVDSVYFGGGTPSLISSEGLEACMKQLRQSFVFADSPEITMEMNPESASFRLLKCAKTVGINRISFGMQSAVPAELSAIGRIHSHEDTIRAVNFAREAGFDNVSLDLMYGLPGQDLSSFEESLSSCFMLSPEHVSFYCLTLSESVPLYQKRHLLPGEEDTRQMYLFASRLLREKGYEHYEISNAAKLGFASRHNLRYWNREPYIGIGPGAHSFFDNSRFAMEEDTEKFISASNHKDLITSREKIDSDEERVEYMMLSLRTKEGIDLKRLDKICNKDQYQRALEKFSFWQKSGLCTKTENGFALTPEGFFVSNAMILELI